MSSAVSQALVDGGWWVVRNVAGGRHSGHGCRDAGLRERGRKGGEGGQAGIMRGSWAGGQSLEAAESDRTGERDLRRT